MSTYPPAARWFLARLICNPQDVVDEFLRKISLHTKYIQEDGSILKCENVTKICAMKIK
jgi:hypothetical protein